MKPLSKIFTTIVLCAALCTKVGAQEQSFSKIVKVEGDVLKPLTLTLDELRARPRDTATLIDRNGKKMLYEGVLLNRLLKEAGVSSDSPLRGEHLAKFALIRCSDGYEVLLSLGELDSDFGNSRAILADMVEEESLPADKGPFRLVVPTDKALARSCYQVERIFIGVGIGQ